MKRTILALAVAGLSVAAYASPPPGGGPPTPIDVNVTNSPLPVSVSNASVNVNVANQPIAVSPQPTLTSPAKFWEWHTSDVGSSKTLDIPLDAPVVLTGVLLRLQMPTTTAGSLDRCFAAVALRYDDPATSDVLFIEKRLVATQALNGAGISELYLPLSNLYANEGDTLSYSVFASEVGQTCLWDIVIYGAEPE